MIQGSWRRQGLTRITLAWAFGSIFFNVTMGAPFAAFARKLGADDFIFGVLSAAPMLGVAMQLISSYLVERTGHRKLLFLVVGTAQRLIWIPIALLPWALTGRNSGLRIALLATLAIFSSLLGHFGSPAWSSWMSDFVPLRVRGAFFAYRMRVGTILGLIAAVVAGAVLDHWPGYSAYTALFIVASICGAIDVLLFTRIPEPPMVKEEELPPLHQLFREPLKSGTFRRFLGFWIAFSVSITLIGPSLWLFCLESLKLSKLQTNLVLMVANMLGIALVSPFWGKLIDRFGSRPVMRVCCVVMVFIPLGWAVAGPSSFWFLFGLTALAGSFWAGIDLANFNMILGIFPQRLRSVYMAVFGVWSGLATALSPMLGGAITGAMGDSLLRVGPFLLDRYQQLFVVSFALRLLAVGLVLPHVRQEGASGTQELLRSVATEVGAKLRRRDEG
ncbi:MAG TPA: MFS transporter [Armatimonadota bacterium]